jgi:hypothetical protein
MFYAGAVSGRGAVTLQPQDVAEQMHLNSQNKSAAH